MSDSKVTVVIHDEHDVVAARQQGRLLSQRAGFTGSSPTLIATAISEIARNILSYAGTGEIAVAIVEAPGRTGIEVVARDKGPGIADIARAMQDGYTTRKGLGLGLPGARRLMDDFEIWSEVGAGTVVTMRKWARE